MDGSFLRKRRMKFPREILAGHGVLADLPETLRGLRIDGAVLILTGPITKGIAGRRVADLLEDEGGFDPTLLELGQATRASLEEAVRAGREAGASAVIGVGGGSKIDLAKAAAAQMGIPAVSVPTSAPHDGIASARVSITDHSEPLTSVAAEPVAVVADTEVIHTAPYRYIASGCADTIANTTAVMDWELAHRLRDVEFSTSAATLSRMAAQVLMDSAREVRAHLEESIWLAIRPIIVSGISMGVANSSRPASGSEHMFAHALDAVSPGRALHGERCGVGAILMMFLHGGDWMRLRTALEAIGAPVDASGLGVTREEVVRALTTAHLVRPGRYTILGDQGLTPAAAERLIEATEVA